MHDLPQGQGLKEMDMLVWLGDFNYRVDAEYAEAKGLVRRNDLSPLLSKVTLPWHSMHAPARRLAPVLGRCCVSLCTAVHAYREIIGLCSGVSQFLVVKTAASACTTPRTSTADRSVCALWPLATGRHTIGYNCHTWLGSARQCADDIRHQSSAQMRSLNKLPHRRAAHCGSSEHMSNLAGR